MRSKTKNRDEFLIHALIIGMFLFVFTALNTNLSSESQNADKQTYEITNLSEIAHSATLSTFPSIPDFNNNWIICKIKSADQNSKTDFSILISNKDFNTKYKIFSKAYLSIKQQSLKIFLIRNKTTNSADEIPVLA